MVCHRVDPGVTKEESHDVNVMENQIVKEPVMVIGVALHLPQFKVLQIHLVFLYIPTVLMVAAVLSRVVYRMVVTLVHLMDLIVSASNNYIDHNDK